MLADVESTRPKTSPSATPAQTVQLVLRLRKELRGAGPGPGTVVHADRGPQCTSWVLGHRLRQAKLLGSMGRVASSVDDTMIESFWSTMKRELLDTRTWDTPDQLASAIFERIEAWYNPRRRHTSLADLAPNEYESVHNTADPAA